MWPCGRLLAASLLFASQAVCGLLPVAGRIVRRDGTMESFARDFTNAMIYDRRDTSSTTTAFNYTAWDISTNAACVSSLTALNGVASNPAGLALCYNIVSMNTSNATFYADMRIYMVSAPTGDFINIPAENVMVAAQFSGATVQTVTDATVQKRDGFSLESWPSVRRTVSRRAMTPTLVQSYDLFGKFNTTSQTALNDVASTEALLTPIVSLTAVTATTPSTSVNTTLSTKEASFITGALTTTNTSSAAIATTTANMTGIAAVVVPSGTLFRMPGTKILIFPIGAIVCGTWTLLLVGTIAYGTVGRIGFRDQFRSRKARELGKVGGR